MGGRWLTFVSFTLVFLLSSVGLSPAVDLKQGVEQLAAELAKGFPAGKELRVAVTDFQDLRGVVTELGCFIAERLTTRLSQKPSISAMERRRFGQVLSELRFGLSDLVDPKKVQKVGELLGVQAIVVGTVTDLGAELDVDARTIEVATSRILPGASVTISKDPVVKRLLEKRCEVVASLEKTPKKPQQDLGQVRVELKSLQLVGGNEAVVQLVFANTNPSRQGIGFALVPQDRGPAFPPCGMLEHIFPCEAKVLLSDDVGTRYRYKAVQGVGFAVKESDWALLGFDEEATVTLTFEKEGGSPSGSMFNLSGEIYIVWRDEERKPLGPKKQGFSLRGLKP